MSQARLGLAAERRTPYIWPAAPTILVGALVGCAMSDPENIFGADEWLRGEALEIKLLNYLQYKK